MRRRTFVGYCAMTMLWVGCGAPQAPLADKEQALQIAKRVMEHWKSGGSLDDLAKEKPAILVREDLWKKGAKLTSYEFAGEGEDFGPSIRFLIRLKTTTADGKTAERQFGYLTTTAPVITFFREEG